MSKYNELDELVLSKINNIPVPFMYLHAGEIHSLCETLSAKKYEGFRVLDRRLQALRKKGLIKSIPGKGWVLCD